MTRRFSAAGWALIGTLVVISPSRADISFGGNARALAMGGAGLAIVDRGERSSRLNPASLALLNRRMKVGYPGVGLRASGIPLSAAYDHLFGNPSGQDASSLARDFGTRDSNFGVGLNWGVRFGHLDATATGVATVRVQPNAALNTWARNANGDVTLLTGAERADMLGAGIYSLPNITVAERISPPGSPTRIQAGARIKLQRGIYSHYIVNSSNIANNTPATPAPELGGGTTLQKDGIGLDLGFLVHPRDIDGWSGALLATNILGPEFRFDGTDRNGTPTQYLLQPRSYSLGTAWQGKRIIVAVDAVDINEAYGAMQGRLGVEYKIGPIALWGGYATNRGLTAGFGWGFLEFAFGAKAPLEVTHTLRF